MILLYILMEVLKKKLFIRIFIFVSFWNINKTINFSIIIRHIIIKKGGYFGRAGLTFSGAISAYLDGVFICRTLQALVKMPYLEEVLICKGFT